jgi:hypothetical protein
VHFFRWTLSHQKTPCVRRNDAASFQTQMREGLGKSGFIEIKIRRSKSDRRKPGWTSWLVLLRSWSRSSADYNFVTKLILGSNPAGTPIEQPTKFELVVNLKTAKALGVSLPESFLLRADQVIE